MTNLCGEDVAGGPRDVGAQLEESLDEDGGLDGYVEAAGDPGALEGLGGAVLLPEVHQAGHLILGQGELLPAPVGQGDVGDLVGDLGHGEQSGGGGGNCGCCSAADGDVT